MKSTGWLIRDERRFHASLAAMRVHVSACSTPSLTAGDGREKGGGEKERMGPDYTPRPAPVRCKADKKRQWPRVSLGSIVAHQSAARAGRGEGQEQQ